MPPQWSRRSSEHGGCAKGPLSCSEGRINNSTGMHRAHPLVITPTVFGQLQLQLERRS